MWKRLFGTRTSGWTAAGLLLRLILGAVFIFHGWGKVTDLSKFGEGVAKLGFPQPGIFAAAAAIAEFVGGIGIVLGLMTRLWALGIVCVMAVAVSQVHWSKGFAAKEGGFEYPLTLLVIALALLIMGPGRASLDDRF